MSKASVVDFFRACHSDMKLLEKFEQKNLPEVIFHTKSLGYSFSGEELAAVIGSMEAQIITEMGEAIDANSSLWRRMWGKSRLQYVIEELFQTFSEAELKQFLN
ncbi:Nif11 family protein [Chroococcidiopsis sp. FACHB-1243]|uniref:Nif11 family protein n=1 Tax=Chroococcidiopsis sp. [FACHB-1243] TaxID=2692781 RepID=UPI0017833B88|nr:Nif11 family protein [Chroococcidiopsis sp. [FACHB-1243]]MBD2305273.1 Nif11 family protein [Chroococcidiopsis sp. [FACHB-1243]]